MLHRTASSSAVVKVLLALVLLGGSGAPPLRAQETVPATVAPTQVAPPPAATAPATTAAPATVPPAASSPAATFPPTTAVAPPAATSTDALVPAMPGAAATGQVSAGTDTAPADPSSAIPAQGGEDVTVSAQLPHDLSPWGMFMAADLVVKAVMLGLAFASVVTWTVWLAKSLELTFAARRLRKALTGYLASPSLEAARAVGALGPAGAMLRATDLELKRSGDLPADGIKERVSISLGRIEVAAGRAITRGTGLLATIGATAPFVGLFGTVWGIMNSFIGISKAQTTNLAVVAPGIAEALLATAIGLVAAIPAVVIYNHFSRQVSGYRVLMGDASAEVLRLLSRDLDRRDVARERRASAGADASREASVRLRAAAE